jgi:hypothetical protein
MDTIFIKSPLVAPYTGAWIETYYWRVEYVNTFVAPYTGAWIETICPTTHFSKVSVAPYTGAWIETVSSSLGRMSAS